MTTPAERIKQKAVEIGFDLVGIGPARRAPHADAFQAWLDSSRHGAMQWLAKDPERRADPRRVVPGAAATISVGVSYYVKDPDPGLWLDPSRGRIARYAWGPDYHDVLTPMLRQLADFIRAESGPDTACRYYVDTGPVLEHEVAWQAGVGFVGRHTLSIRPGYGSYIFLGEIITNLDLELDSPAADEGASLSPSASSTRRGTCGRCRRCLDACPTHAFPAEYVLDSRLCISYLTIENKDAVPESLRPLMKNWIYGCDECQEVCPWVRRYSRPGRTRFLSADPDRIAPRLLDLIAMDEGEFRRRFRGTPIARVKRRGLLRNVAVALGNWGAAEARPALERAATDPEPLIREHAAWALRQTQVRQSPPGGESPAWDA